MSDKSPHNIHDSFFRKTLSHRVVAADFLSNYLPAPVLQHIEMDTLAICKETFVDARQAAHYSDVLYRVSLKGDVAGFVYVLFEHKSSPDRYTALQLLRYMVEIWDLFYKQHPRKKHWPLIIPVVVYHGKPKSKAVRLADLVHIPDERLRGYVPDFDINFYDFSPKSSEAIKGQVPLQSMLYCLKAAHHTQAPRIVLEIFRCISQLGEDEYDMQWIKMVWQYVAEAVDIEPKEIAELAQQNLFGKKRAEIMTLAQRLEQQGEARGIALGLAKGEAKGRTEGRTEILNRLLARKFGAQELTFAVQQRLQLATTDQLDHWGERILDAKSIAEVFTDN